MYIKNGIVYGGEPKSSLTVLKVKILPGKIMLITFSNNETRLFDGTILKDGVFKKLDDESVFEDVKVDHGVITWLNGEIDCAPEFMYKNSYEYPPLEENEMNEWDYMADVEKEKESNEMAIFIS